MACWKHRYEGVGDCAQCVLEARLATAEAENADCHAENIRLSADLGGIIDRSNDLERQLVLATHGIAEDHGQYPYCSECEARWPCEPFKAAEAASRAASKATEGGEKDESKV